MKLHKNISQSVIQALKTIFSEGAYADDTVRNLLQSNPKWGSRDRRFIASSIYTVVRWWKRYAFIANTSIEDASCFEKVLSVYLHETYGATLETPLPIELNIDTYTERAALAMQIRALNGAIDEWMDALCAQELGEALWEKELVFLNQEADVFVRVNMLKSKPKNVIEILAKEGVVAVPFGPLAETLKLAERKPLQRLASFVNGDYEVQDSGSQLIAHYLNPNPGSRVVDACAGAGGKSLHIAALMGNKGQIVSMDTEAFKLEELERRATRAGVRCIQTKAIKEGVIASLKNTADFYAFKRTTRLATLLLQYIRRTT